MRGSRRRVLGALGAALGALALAPAPVRAQARRPLVGVLVPAGEQWDEPAFRDELGRLVAADLEVRSARGNLSSLPELARSLVASRVDVLVAANTPGGRAASAATKTIPIVVGVVSEPSLVGVRNISRPEGNITGVTNMAGEIVAKRLEMLKEALPGAQRIAALIHPNEPIVKSQMRDLAPAAQALGVELRYFAAGTEAELRAVIDAMAAWGAHALFRLAGQAQTMADLQVRLAVERGIPPMMLTSDHVEAGALLSYFADHAAIWRRVAQYVERLLNGARVIDLPFERPTKFELAINLRTARVLGIAIPPALISRADRVIQ